MDISVQLSLQNIICHIMHQLCLQPNSFQSIFHTEAKTTKKKKNPKPQNPTTNKQEAHLFA